MLNGVDKNRIILMSRAGHKGSRAIAKELNLNRKTVQRVLRKYAEAIAAEDPDEALLEALAETPKDATSIAIGEIKDNIRKISEEKGLGRF